MRHGGHLVSDAHVRTPVVVEVDVAFDDTVGVLEGTETLPVDTFHLYYAVGSLCDGIVRRVIVLTHGDGDAVFPEHSHIVVTAVLHAPVGVVGQPFKDLTSAHVNGLVDSHLQSLHRDDGLERLGKCPAHDFVRVGIGDKVQIAHVASGQGDVGDVGHPELVGSSGHKAFNQVLVLVVAMVRVRRVTGLRLGEHQSLATQKHKETVTARNKITTEHRNEHQPQLVAADAGILRADLPDGTDDLPLMIHLFLNVSLRLVEGLTAMAK